LIPIALSWFVILGLPAALLLDRDAPPRRLLGTAFLLGTGIVALILLAMSVVGVEWTLLRVTIACCVTALALGPPASRRLAQRRPAAAGDGRSETLLGQPARTPAVPFVVDLATLLLIIAHAVFATLARVGVWDFWAIFGFKARVFFLRGGIDWPFLEHPYHAFAHPDYPPLLSLDYDFLALHHGAWDDRWLGILTTLFAAALLLIVRDCFAEELPPLLAAMATFGVASIALTQWIGMAEAPMIAFGTAALLLIRRGSPVCGAVLLGFAALTKNEGLALLVAVSIAMALSARRKEMLRLWPAVAIAAPWLLLRAVHDLPTDLASGALTERAAHPVVEVLRTIAATPPAHPLFWIAVVASLLLGLFAGDRSLRRERFLLIAVALQLVFYIAAYVVTPNDLHWHITNSWLRLLDQMAVPLAFMALLASGRFFATLGGNLWTVVGGGGTNMSLDSEKRGTERIDGAQPRKDRRKGPTQGPGHVPQDH
jgi:hypothetical protein